MAETTIQWTWRRLPNGTLIKGYSFNPWWGCFKVSPGCTHCYAEELASRWNFKVWGPAATTSRRFFGEKHWAEPLTWNRQAEKSGHRRSVFCASMADVFEDDPEVIQARIQLHILIESTPWLNWLLLTKRPENVLGIQGMVPPRWWLHGEEGWPDNVWIGTSVENQHYADERLPALVKIPAPVRFVSYEPALGPVDFQPYLPQIHWVICGGESGAKHRPFDLNWARSARNQVLAGRELGFETQFFFKQVGGLNHTSGGRLLDGRTWDEVPPEYPERNTNNARIESERLQG